jgi:hypothetical protein
MSNDQN